jgi:carboxyl-terminal processing protease
MQRSVNSRPRRASVGLAAYLVACLAACLVACFVAGLVTGCATLRPGHKVHAAPRLTPEQRQLNVDSFEHIWQTIRDKHWDPTLGGLDWPAIREELLPRVAAAETMPAARAVMNDLISRLGQSHFQIIPADYYQDLDLPEAHGAASGEVGIDVRVVAGEALVTAVDQDSWAQRAGVRPGWQILAIDGREITKRLAHLEGEFAGKTFHDLILASAVSGRLQGDIGTKVTVRFLDATGRKLDCDLVRSVPRGRLVNFGNLPPQHVWIETRRLDGGIGYIAFNMFLDPTNVMQAFNDAMTTYLDAPGVIIDLRGNPGGLGAMAMGMAGWLVDRPGQRLGTMRMRENEIKFVMSVRPSTYAGPVAVLVDGLSASTSEILAGGLQDLGRARVFGSRSAGMALPSQIERLANGDGFQYAFANYISEGGQVLEGSGVTPDVVAEPTRAALLEGRDPALDAAIAWIQEVQS